VAAAVLGSADICLIEFINEFCIVVVLNGRLAPQPGAVLFFIAQIGI
jgi:hypothetical protein